MKPDLQMETLNFDVPIANVDEINELLRRYGVKFGIYKNGVFKDQLFPFDPIPRIITAQDFTAIEKGLIQRVDALNMFIYDIYHDKKNNRRQDSAGGFRVHFKRVSAPVRGHYPAEEHLQPHFGH